MPINLDAVGYTIDPFTVEWTKRDTLLYALAVGCGSEDIPFTTENSIGVTPRVLPTFAVAVYDVPKLLLPALGEYDDSALVHGEQSMTFHRSLEPEGRAVVHGGIAQIQDKGSGALIDLWTKAVDVSDGAPLFDLTMRVFLIGAGGWRGENAKRRDPPQRPDCAPDSMIVHQTAVDQALLYRLTGDRNPLHSDPVFAARSGFGRPILHGLCTLGIAGRHLLRLLCGDDPSRMRHLEGRFAAPVLPGDTLECAVWRLEPGKALFEVAVETRNVINRGVCLFDP